MQPVSSMHRWRARVATALAALLVGLCLQSPAFAKKVTRGGSSESAHQAQREEVARPLAGNSLDKIIAAVQKRHGATVVKSEETTVQGRKAYILRLHYKDGLIKHIKVDAETGKEL
jgi:uncharacterized membrane protein YkoI